MANVEMLVQGVGGSASVIASQVSSQASVPHQDVALVISLITLWTAVGGGIGSAIAAAIWNNTSKPAQPSQSELPLTRMHSAWQAASLSSRVGDR